MKTPFTTLLVQLYHLISAKRRRQLFILLFLMVISAFAEVVSLGLVIPFLGILFSPQKVFENPIVSSFATQLGFTTSHQIILPLTVLFITAALLAGFIRVLLLWLSTRVTFACGADLSFEVYRRTLYQPYQVHLMRNSSEVIGSVISKVNHVVFWVLQQILILISSMFLFVSVIIALFFIHPKVAFVSIVGFGGSYFIMTLLSRRYLRKNSLVVAREENHVIKALQEGLGGIRDVLLDGTQSVYCDIFRNADRPLRHAYGNNAFIGGSPRFIMEAIGMSFIAGLAYWLSLRAGGMTEALPVLGALALGAQRILPALQQGYAALTSMLASHATLAEVIQMLQQKIPDEFLITEKNPLSFQKSIQFCDIDFKYQAESALVLNQVNLQIEKGSRVGIIGPSGSGKSTLIDILMGLLSPTSGKVLVDGKVIEGRILRSWQQTIAHVPQSIYLADSSLAENIAFGIPLEEIDMARVRLAAQQAQIADFIEGRPGGYLANVGERGVRLSGGQRQRIGIARALYKQAKVIIFDEATSALDSETEDGVINAIESLSRDLTLIIVAHRLTTIQRCDDFFEMSSGKLRKMNNLKEEL